jgi:hypothetical protein
MRTQLPPLLATEIGAIKPKMIGRKITAGCISLPGFEWQAAVQRT